MHEFFAPCPRGLEAVLARELTELGARAPEQLRAGVAFRGDLELGYRACLWSRVASRVLLVLSRFDVAETQALYDGTRTVQWQEHVAPDGSLAVHAVCRGAAIDHSGFAALKVKDAIVDQLRERHGIRPSVDTDQPDLRVHLHLHREQATLYVALSGEALHRRHYRGSGGQAPLKENLAAGLLLLADWPTLARQGQPFLDPMCGSGTLPIEAAQMAADIAPGLLRDPLGLQRWRGHDPDAWARLQAEAARRAAASRPSPPIVGFDADPVAVERALNNARRAGVERRLRLEHRALSALAQPTLELPPGPGLLLVNPPYGQRMGQLEALFPLYTQLGDLFKQRFAGWLACVLTSERELASYVGLRPGRRHEVFNGAIECRLLCYPIVAGSARQARPHDADEQEPSATGAEDFANRLRKNQRRLGRWANRAGISCYRVYDADLPDYAVAIDRYEDWVHVQEYAAPDTIDPGAARRRVRQVLGIIPGLLGVDPSHVFFKVRRRQRGSGQYQRLSDSGAEREVQEGGHRFLVNLQDHLDSLLFLEQRQSRAHIAELAARRGGQRFLNLFCYTGAATVYAASAGAATVSVDLSATYLDWARRNLALNGLGPAHQLVRADCLEWIKHQGGGALERGATRARDRGRFDLIYLNPPTFSRSTSMHGTLDIQRDHVWILRATARLLTPDGVLLFATNARRFKLDVGSLPELAVEDISRRMLPLDFARTPWVHRVFSIRSGPTSDQGV